MKDGRERTIRYVTDLNGQVLSRVEADTITATDDPEARYFYAGGVRVGEVGNDASARRRTM